MSVTAIGSYEYETHDTADRFSAPLLYVAWDEHMIFAAPAVVQLSMHTHMADERAQRVRGGGCRARGAQGQGPVRRSWGGGGGGAVANPGGVL